MAERWQPFRKASGPSVRRRALEGDDVDGTELRAQPRARADLDARARAEREPEQAAVALGHHAGTDPQPRARAERIVRVREVAARGRIDLEAGVQEPERAQAQTIGGLDGVEQQDDGLLPQRAHRAVVCPSRSRKVMKPWVGS